jgi:hypothetical protein
MSALMMFIHHNPQTRLRGPSPAILSTSEISLDKSQHYAYILVAWVDSKSEITQLSKHHHFRNVSPVFTYQHYLFSCLCNKFFLSKYCVTKKNWWENSGDKRKVQTWVLMDIIQLQYSKWGKSLNSHNDYNSWTVGGGGFKHAKNVVTWRNRQLGKTEVGRFFF